jgi:hypothetical protein
MVLVTQDSQGRTQVDWYEDEDGWYNGDPIATVVAAHSTRIGRNAPIEVGKQAAATYMLLAGDHKADVSYLATHTVSEPGGHPELIVRCDGSRTCQQDMHLATCLGLYRTEDEVRLSVVPTVEVLQQRRRDETTLRGLEALTGGAS